MAKLIAAARELPLPVASALVASAEAYTPRAAKMLDEAREQLAPIADLAAALAENLPEPKPPRRSRRRRRKKRRAAPVEAAAAQTVTAALSGGDGRVPLALPPGPPLPAAEAVEALGEGGGEG
jgi:hypothetical protein